MVKCQIFDESEIAVELLTIYQLLLILQKLVEIVVELKKLSHKD